MKLAYIFDSRIIGTRSGSLVHVVEMLQAFEHTGVKCSILTAHKTQEISLEELVSTVNTAIIRTSGNALGKVASLLPSAVRQRTANLRQARGDMKAILSARSAFNFFYDRLASCRPDALYQRHNVFLTPAIKAARSLNIPVVLEVNVPVFYEADGGSYCVSFTKRMK